MGGGKIACFIWPWRIRSIPVLMLMLRVFEYKWFNVSLPRHTKYYCHNSSVLSGWQLTAITTTDENMSTSSSSSMTSTDETCPLMSSSSMIQSCHLPPICLYWHESAMENGQSSSDRQSRAELHRQDNHNKEWWRNDSNNNKQRVTRIRTIRNNCKKSGWESKQFQGNTKHSKKFSPTQSNHIGHPMIVKQQHEMFCAQSRCIYYYFVHVVLVIVVVFVWGVGKKALEIF